MKVLASSIISLLLLLTTACTGNSADGPDLSASTRSQAKVSQANVSQANKSPNESSKTKKNILFILVDDLGYSDIGVYNPDTFYSTPNIDKLAAEGILFTNGYAANPVCSPTRAAIMTGKHPSRLQATEWFHINNWPHRVERFNPGVNKDYLASEETTIAEVFNAQGYDTAFVGKWHLGHEESMLPENQGFDVNIGGAAFGYPRGGYFSPYNNPALEDGPDGEYLTDRLTDEAISLIDASLETDNPFFIMLSYYTVHVPLEAPQNLLDKYELKKSEQSQDGAEFGDEDQYFISEPSPRSVRIKQNHVTYAAMIEKLDENVGRVMASLKKAGLEDDTIVVFTSDNGGLSTSEGHPTSSLPLRGGKGWLYEGGIRVPLIIHASGSQQQGQRVDQPAVSMDFLPTLTTLTDVSLPNIEGMDGINLGLMTPNQSQAERPLYWHYPHYSNQGGFPGAAVRKGDYKLLQNFEDGSLQLYDLSKDIGEKNDIKTSYPEITQQLQGLLYQWYQEVDAQFLRPKDGSDEVPWAPPALVEAR